MKPLQTFDRWHKTSAGYTVAGLVELAISYGIGSLAINSGSWWEYVLTLIFLIGALQNFVKLIGSVLHGKDKKAKA